MSHPHFFTRFFVMGEEKKFHFFLLPSQKIV